MKKNFVFITGFLLVPMLAVCFQAGPKSQANFGNNQREDTTAEPSNSKTRSLSTYGAGRTWSRGVQTQGVQTQVAGRAKVEKEEQQPAPQGPFVDKADAQLAGLKGKIANGGKGGNKATSPSGKSAVPDKQVGATQKAEAVKEEPAPEQAQAGAMPAGMDAVMQQMGQMQNMMNMMGAMGGGAGGANGAGGAAAGGGMPAGMPDISALMGSMGAMGGGAPAKK